MTETYDQLYAEAEAFEEFVLDRLAEEWGVRLARTTTYQDQRTWGDTRILEIKLDRRFAETGNLCIETHERPSRPGTLRRLPFVPSGILAESGAFLYGIGNREEFFVFSRRTLVDLSRALRTGGGVRSYETSTSRGFLIPRHVISTYAEVCYLWTPPVDLTYNPAAHEAHGAAGDPPLADPDPRPAGPGSLGGGPGVEVPPDPGLAPGRRPPTMEGRG